MRRRDDVDDKSRSIDHHTDAAEFPVTCPAVRKQPEMQTGKTPMMVSLHATKVFGIGEGGILLSTNEELIYKVERMTQFGFLKNDHHSHLLGMNGKLSEYACAVGLAVLDEWPESREKWRSLSKCYQSFFKKNSINHMLSTDWVTSMCNIIVSDRAYSLMHQLQDIGISSRKWWNEGCHRQPVFTQAPSLSELSNTEYLQRSVLGIPFYIDMKNEDMQATHEAIVLSCQLSLA